MYCCVIAIKPSIPNWIASKTSWKIPLMIAWECDSQLMIIPYNPKDIQGSITPELIINQPFFIHYVYSCFMVLKYEKNKQTPDIDGQIPTPKCFRSAMAMAISLEDFLVGQSRASLDIRIWETRRGPQTIGVYGFTYMMWTRKIITWLTWYTLR